MPARCSNWPSSRPEGPAPTISTWVRKVFMAIRPSGEARGVVSDGRSLRRGRSAVNGRRRRALAQSEPMPESRPKSSSRSRAGATPVYSLYGEEGQAPALDGLHLESIAERSRLHNWEIQPHRHGALVQLLLIERGRVVVRMDEDERELRAPALVWVPALAVHGFRFAPETEGLVVTLDQGRLRDLLDHLPDLLESLAEPRLVPLERGATVTRALFAVGHGLREDYAGGHGRAV
ncbi:hypothetical protein FUT87_11555 [Mitsuaria sp. TWR114]|nr:hypothetical protein FUT87_11555 [Mitsuaria sp. TWR114]